jgi:hypothetical protein
MVLRYGELEAVAEVAGLVATFHGWLTELALAVVHVMPASVTEV